MPPSSAATVSYPAIGLPPSGVLNRCAVARVPSGDFKYQFMPELVNLPSSESGNDENGHGVCKHTDGSIFFTFVRASAVPSSLSHRLTMCAAHRSPRRSTTPRRC